MDASNLLKPALQAASCDCMGSTTYKEFRQHFEKDRALVAPVPEDRRARNRRWKIRSRSCNGLKPYFESITSVAYTPDAIKHAVELARRYINDRKLPDKAIDVIDEAGAAQMLVPESKAQEPSVKEIEAVVAKIARIPPKTCPRRSESAQDSGCDLKRVVFGQDRRSKRWHRHQARPCGLREPDKPIG